MQLEWIGSRSAGGGDTQLGRIDVAKVGSHAASISHPVLNEQAAGTPARSASVLAFVASRSQSATQYTPGTSRQAAS